MNGTLIDIIAGARPNFMKIAVIRAIKVRGSVKSWMQTWFMSGLPKRPTDRKFWAVSSTPSCTTWAPTRASLPGVCSE